VVFGIIARASNCAMSFRLLDRMKFSPLFSARLFAALAIYAGCLHGTGRPKKYECARCRRLPESFPVSLPRPTLRCSHCVTVHVRSLRSETAWFPRSQPPLTTHRPSATCRQDRVLAQASGRDTGGFAALPPAPTPPSARSRHLHSAPASARQPLSRTENWHHPGHAR